MNEFEIGRMRGEAFWIYYFRKDYKPSCNDCFMAFYPKEFWNE